MPDRLVTIRSFTLPWEADLCRLWLEEEGIRAVVTEDRSAMINYFWSIALGGVKVQVAQPDAERAETILKDVRIESDESRDRVKLFVVAWIGLMVLFLLLGMLGLG